jgi:hypothetical protein
MIGVLFLGFRNSYVARTYSAEESVRYLDLSPQQVCQLRIRHHPQDLILQSLCSITNLCNFAAEIQRKM